jgi:hypothetical protein
MPDTQIFKVRHRRVPLTDSDPHRSSYDHVLLQATYSGIPVYEMCVQFDANVAPGLTTVSGLGCAKA